MNKPTRNLAIGQRQAVRFLCLRRQSDALTIELDGGSAQLTVGVIAAEGDQVLLSIDSSEAPDAKLTKEAVATVPGHMNTGRYLRSLACPT